MALRGEAAAPQRRIALGRVQRRHHRIRRPAGGARHGGRHHRAQSRGRPAARERAPAARADRTISDIVVITETDGRIRYVGPSIKRILGFRPRRCIGTNGFDGVHPDDHERVWPPIGEMAAAPAARVIAAYRSRRATAVALAGEHRDQPARRSDHRRHHHQQPRHHRARSRRRPPIAPSSTTRCRGC